MEELQWLGINWDEGADPELPLPSPKADVARFA